MPDGDSSYPSFPSVQITPHVETLATLPFVQKIARDLRESVESDLLEQTEFSHVAVNELFKKS